MSIKVKIHSVRVWESAPSRPDAFQVSRRYSTRGRLPNQVRAANAAFIASFIANPPMHEDIRWTAMAAVEPDDDDTGTDEPKWILYDATVLIKWNGKELRDNLMDSANALATFRATLQSRK